MDIGRTDGVGGPGRVEGPRPPHRITPPQAASPAPADKVEISEAAQLISEALALPQVRSERVDEVRKLIESGRFDNDERLEAAVDKFLRDNPDLLP